VRFLTDAQLPATLAQLLQRSGHDAIHVSALPAGNSTTGAEVARVANDDERVLVTKDRDFRESHLLAGKPLALLTVTTGNIANRELLALFQKHLDAIVDFLSSTAFVELAHDRLIAHSRERRRE
jgi:predicted nuclease of predicted toxin-antitoxin system